MRRVCWVMLLMVCGASARAETVRVGRSLTLSFDAPLPLVEDFDFNTSRCWVNGIEALSPVPTPLVQGTGICYTPPSGTANYSYRFEIVFRPVSEADVGHYDVYCQAWGVGAAGRICSDWPNPCDYSCTADTYEFFDHSWSIDVVSALDPATISGVTSGLEVGDTLVLDATPTFSQVRYDWDVRRPDGTYLSDVDLDPHFEMLLDRPGSWRVDLNSVRISDGVRIGSDFVDVYIPFYDPQIAFDGLEEIDVGQSIVVATTELDDRDGGALRFLWRVRQAPSSGVADFSAIPNDESLIVLPNTDARHAGTWVFELEACDDENVCVTGLFEVLVDAPPSADIEGPSFAEERDFPVSLRGRGSIDPDTDTEYFVDGITPRITAGVQTYRWYLDAFPPEYASRYRINEPVSASILVFDSAEYLTFLPEVIEPGHYRFRLKVTDAEGNEASTTHEIDFQPRSAPPIAVLSAPRRYFTDVDGYLYESIIVDGSSSFDYDDVFAVPPSSGIEHYDWQITVPPGCPVPAAGDAPVVELNSGTWLPPQCLGAWIVRLEVTDAEGESATAESQIIIGNCPSSACIDYPTNSNRAELITGRPIDVPIAYHVDPALFTQPRFAFGLMARIQIRAASGAVIYEVYDPAPYESAPGEVLVFRWNGLTTAGAPAPAGDYDVVLALIDQSFNVTELGDVELDAISAESADFEPMAIDRLVSHRGLQRGDAGFSFAFELRGSRGVDVYRWTINDPSGTRIHQEVVHSELQSLEGWWDGRAPAGIAAPGNYTLKMEAYREGQLLANESFTFAIYRFELTPVPAIVAPRVELGAALQVRATSVPLVRGTARLTGDAGLPVSETRAVTTAALNWTRSVQPAIAGQVVLRLGFTADDGTALEGAELPINVVHLAVVDALMNPATHVEVGLWLAAHDETGALHDNFIDLELFRFQLRAVDRAANVNPGIRDRIIAEVGTVFDATATGGPDFTDAPTMIELLETTEDSGVFLSKTQLLTSNDGPLLLESDDQITMPGALEPDESFDDRTHRVGRDGRDYIRGGVWVQAPSRGMTPKIVPVCARSPDERARVGLHVTVWLEPWENGTCASCDPDERTPGFDWHDENNDGVQQLTEDSENYRDLSQGNGDFRPGGGMIPPLDVWGPVASRAYVEDEIRKANLAWAPACLEFDLLSYTTTTAPDSILHDGKIDFDRFNPAQREGGPIIRSYALPTPMHEARVIVVGPRLVAFDAAHPLDPFTELAGGTIYSKFARSDASIILLRSNNSIDLRTLAHELGHALINGDDVETPRHIFFPTLIGGPSDHWVLGHRRMDFVTRVNARLVRAIGDFNAPGNILQRPY